MSQLNDPLLEIFRAHGVEANIEGDWIVFPNSRLKASAAIVKEIEHPTGMTVQLDVALQISLGRTLLESCAGIGEDRETAIVDAFRSFMGNAFHVLLAAFFGRENDQVAQEEWTIGGVERQVILGNLSTRGKVTDDRSEQLLKCLEQFEPLLKAQNLGPQHHWVRLYYAQVNAKPTVCEVMLNNAFSEEMQLAVAAFDWPSVQDFYSARLFLVVVGQEEEGVTPEGAVNYLAEVVAAHPDWTEDQTYAALTAVEIPEELAQRAYRLTQIAWGRLLLSKTGITFSPDYFFFDANGNVVESGRLLDEPCFVAASRIAPQRLHQHTEGFKSLALASAEVNAINNLLNAGSKLENLVTGPACILASDTTPSGQQKVQQFMSQWASSQRRGQAQTTPQAEPPKAKTGFWQRIGFGKR